MIRLAFILSLLAGPALAQSAPIDPIADRPGRWISLPSNDAPAAVMEAPSAAPLIPTTSAPAVVLAAPEAAPLIEPPRAAPDTRPTPRPRTIAPVQVADDPQAPEIAAEVAAILAVPTLAEPVVAPAVEEAVVAPAVEQVPEPLVEPAAFEIAAPVAEPETAPAIVEDVAVADPVIVPTSPAPVEVGLDAAEMAEALAAQIAEQARAIVVSGPRDIPQTSPDIGELLSFDNLDPVARAVIDEVLEQLVVDAAQIRPLSAPAPVFSVAFPVASVHPSVEPVSAVLLPDVMQFAVTAVPPRVAVVPTRERAPILPYLRPSGPIVLDGVPRLLPQDITQLSAALLPSAARATVPMDVPEFAVVPARDLFPYSALPPSALPNGPDALSRTTPPRAPFTEANAAVLIPGISVSPIQVAFMTAPARPLQDEAPINPDAPRALPEPDAGAIARLIDDAQICWRLADLSVEARWAEVSVDVALDEWNMPSEASITLTGFAHVVSGAAEDAYRAAHAALVGCAIASDHAPATAATTLLFDRDGVHLR